MDFLMSFRRLDVKLDRVLQGIFLVAASGIVLVDAIPLLRRRLLVYGVRGTPTEEMHLKTADAPSSPIPIFESELSTPTSNTPAPYVGLLTQPFVQLLALNVPHSWYTHFYILSVLSSIFWGWQLLSEGPVLRTVLAYYDSVGEEARETKGMTMNQIVLVWALMGAQGVRRLYESVAVFKPSASTMSIFHYIGGLGFYGLIGIAVWIEGASTLATHKLTYPDLFPNAPSLRTMICLPVFMFASGIQHDCHCYLASLKKYSLPEHPMFNYIVSPHYSAECLIYLSLALIAAPPERLINRTLLSALAFIVANLTIAARMSKEWYIRKFDEEKVKEKWAIVPPIF